MQVAKSSLLSESSDEARRVRRARERMHAGDEPDRSLVRPVILESWRRSRSAAVDPEWGSKPEPNGRAASVEEPRDERLRSAAAPVLRFLADALADHPFLLMLTDRRCRPLDLVGAGASLREGEWINAVAGGEWREDRVGTDAVALCHATGRPVQVHWYEHYAAVADPWTGNASPIRDPETAEILGTMNIYAYGCIAHPQAFELATTATSMVEERLALEEERTRGRLLESYEDHLSRHPGDPTLCLSRRGVVLALSAAATESLRVHGARAKGRPLASLPGIRLAPGLGDFEAIEAGRVVELRRGDERLAAELHPIEREREIAGFLLRLRPGSRLRRRREASAWRTAHELADVIGESAAIRAALAQAELVAKRDCTVLLVGESGTGKELLAHGIHAASARAEGPFVPVNCGAFGGDLLASELFGYEEGAFTGAARGGRAGKLEIANGGTLFLDELEATSPAMQVLLLRVLEERSLVRVGGERPRPVDVRIVAATNVDLADLVDRGRFRADLRYRLSVFPIVVPPLRERAVDVRPLAEHLLACEGFEKMLDLAAVERLERQPWPGNVRELRNVLVQAALRSPESIIRAADLPLPEETLAPPRDEPPDVGLLRESERRTILAALERHGGSIGRAAAELGIHRVTLYRKLRRHGFRWTHDYR
jgi:sigma-54 dependent transcriptional regulator, acetoin dehydrogenase operon transcriptional activator AcoR